VSGSYVVFEGPDNSGKTTLRNAVHDAICVFNGGAAVKGRFPSDGEIGEFIRHVLRGGKKVDLRSMLYLFFSDGVDQDRVIARFLKQHVTVLVDRHPTISGVAYQPDDHSLDVIYKVYSTFELLKPDHLFFVDIPVSVSLEREAKKAKYKDVVYEGRGAEYLERIHRRYSLLHKTVSNKAGDPAVVLDGTRPVEELRDIVLCQIGYSRLVV
jgi:dTMP kinase